MSKRLLKIIANYAVVDLSELKEDARLIEDLGIDSITMFEIITAIEAEYALEDISEAKIKEIKTVGDIQRIVNEYRLEI